MAKFVFRFAAFLRLKEKIEEQKKTAYGEALRKLEEEKNKKTAILRDRERMIDSFRKNLENKISPADAQAHNNYLAYLKEASARQDKAVKRAEEEAERRRAELQEAMKERKKMEKLRERAQERHIIEEKKDEAKVTDGIVSYKYGKR
ncbi:MAG: flagellar export protein FliJ [Clostridiales bacterium]|jgi:flagellar FliJ protein|nr:flagellar export protein FliJ [Clostridiales bacterium]